MNKLSLVGNTSLQTFINTAKNSFDSRKEVSVWIDNIDSLFYDMRDAKKIVVAIIDGGDSYEELKDRAKIFESMLEIDFDVDFRVSTTPLKLKMIEVWSTTRKSDVFVDLSFDKEDLGKTIYVPFDYYLLKKPIIFLDKETVLTNNELQTVAVDNPEQLCEVLPYYKYTIDRCNN